MSKNLDLIKNDPYFSNFLKKNNLSDGFVEDHIGKFLRVYKSRSLCNNCQGLNNCAQACRGERLDLTYDGVLIDEVEYCDYALNKLKKQNLSKSYAYCDVPESLIGIDLNNVNYTDEQKGLYLELAAILHKKTNKGLYIAGDLGVGKTYLCAALANSLVKNGERVAFVKVSNFFNEMKSYINNKNDLMDKNINALMKSTYLFLDDIGSEAVSEFVRDDILFRVLDYRLENKLTTIFTSNLNKEDLLKHYTYDRKDNSNLMNAKRLMERIDILSVDFVLSGKNMRR